jgi:hypothetical protein
MRLSLASLLACAEKEVVGRGEIWGQALVSLDRHFRPLGGQARDRQALRNFVWATNRYLPTPAFEPLL